MPTAETVGLRYTNDAEPGIGRRRAGKGFSYHGPDGKRIVDPEKVRWIRSLVIPPAWEDVWISSDPHGHLLASGRDAKGRKQYRYHPQWRAEQETQKFDRMLEFGRVLPTIRARVDADLNRKELGREKVTALVVRLLETTLIRVGNEEYARLNKSFGLTTLRDRHLKVDGQQLKFRFRGKSGKEHEVTVKSRRLARLAKQCQDVPGQELFQYRDAEGERRRVGSDEVNAYLREATGQDFTAKDFRTWAGTVLACWALSELQSFDNQAGAKRNITAAVKSVAGRLGNTPTICRKSYVHPVVFEGYLDGSLVQAIRSEIERELREELRGLTGEEAVVLSFLQRRLAAETAAKRGGTPEETITLSPDPAQAAA